MVKLTKIYTRTGDGGETGLVDGSRLPKSARRMEAIGDVDEANSAIGIALTLIADEAARAMLRRIQNELFDLGADIATPFGPAISEATALRIVPAQIVRLESEIDAMNASLAPLTSFILPGGDPGAAGLHLARTIVRRAERALVAASGDVAINPSALAYINRLSDHLFVLCRQINGGGTRDILWKPGATR